uniref:Odorant receptor n=1 Tax=Diabrotica virgifera virgifera TaxID=50390 RepID=A0A6P7G1F0_DIAVI
MTIIALLTTLSSAAALFIIVNGKFSMEEIVGPIGVTLLWTATLARTLQLKRKQTKKLVNNILTFEKRILDSQDEDIIDIFTRYALRNVLISKIYTIGVALDFLTYGFLPLLQSNPTSTKKTLPIVLWMPFNEQEHFTVAYAITCFYGFTICLFVLSADIFSFGLIIFPLSQLEILQQIFRNFDKYAIKMRSQLNTSWSKARMATLKKCVNLHQEIIQYIKDYNDLFRTVTLFDAIQSSVQLSSIVLEVVMTGPTLTKLLEAASFASSTLIRLFIYYWYADDVLIQSTRITQALIDSNWHEQPIEIQKMMLFIIMRSNRQLKMDLGQFTNMSLNVFITIIRASYSYFTLVYGTN